MGLADAITAAKTRDQIRAWDEGERRVAAELKLTIPAPTLTPDIHESLGVFAKWCELNSVRKCPTKSKSAAAFVLHQASLGANSEVLLAMVQAIDALHQYHGLSSPIHTAAVHAALERVIQTEPPRSWPKQDKVAFALLPPDIKQIIATRELQRDNEIRRLQSKTALEIARRDDGPFKPVIKPTEDISHEQRTQQR